MNLQPINKPLYRKRLNIVIAVFILSFALLAVSFGQILIHFLSDVTLTSLSVEASEQPNNFKLNLLGVVLGLLVSSLVLNYLKHTLFFKEIYYVWRLKQIHNRIYRKLSKIKKLAQQDNKNAYIVLNFYYESLKFVYELDDNTLVISKVNKDITELNTRMADANLTVTLDEFSEPLLSAIEKQLPELTLT